MKTKPPAAGINTAYKVIEEANTYFLDLMNAAKIPGASASVWYGGYGQPEVHLRASRRVFRNCDGRRNLESTRTSYNNAEKIIAEVGEHLKTKTAV